MASTQQWAFALTLYFGIVAMIVTIGAGLIQIGSSISYSGGHQITAVSGQLAATNQTAAPVEASVVFDWGQWMKDMISLTVFNISFESDNSFLYDYWWIFRFFFIYIPTIFSLYTIYYSIRSGN